MRIFNIPKRKKDLRCVIDHVTFASLSLTVTLILLPCSSFIHSLTFLCGLVMSSDHHGIQNPLQQVDHLKKELSETRKGKANSQVSTV